MFQKIHSIQYVHHQVVSRCFVVSVLQEYSKTATKSSLKELKTSLLCDGVSTFGLSFNKFSFSLVALTDTTGAFKFSRQQQ